MILMLFWKKKLFRRKNLSGRHGGAERFAASRSDQIFSPMGEPFGTTVISKTYLQKFQMNSSLGRYQSNVFIGEILSYDCSWKQTLFPVLAITTTYLNHPWNGSFKFNKSNWCQRCTYHLTVTICSEECIILLHLETKSIHLMKLIFLCVWNYTANYVQIYDD